MVEVQDSAICDGAGGLSQPYCLDITDAERRARLSGSLFVDEELLVCTPMDWDI